MDSMLLTRYLRRLPSSKTTWTDLAGLVASLGCAIHCAAMPIVMGSLPSLGLTWIAGDRFHQWMAVICAVIALIAFVPGWRRHRRFAPLMLGGVGIALLSSAAFFLEPCCDHPVSANDTNWQSALAGQACDTCEACAGTAPARAETLPSWGSTIEPYVTPIGGLVLIVAHLLNHRFGCRCCSGEQHCQNDKGGDLKWTL